MALLRSSLASCPADARSEQRDLLLRSAGISPRTKNSASSRGLLPRRRQAGVGPRRRLGPGG
jgi:hypothetical protein